MTELPLERIDDYMWEIPAGARPGMRVPGRIFADQELVRALQRDRSLEQLANVATLPGITTAALAMPDVVTVITVWKAAIAAAQPGAVTAIFGFTVAAPGDAWR